MLWRDHPLLGPAEAMPTHFWGPEEEDYQAATELGTRVALSRPLEVLLAALEGCERIVEVGGGSGQLARAVAARFGRCTVVEPSAAQYAKIRPEPGTSIDVRPGRAEALPLPDASCDGVFAAQLLQHTSDPFVSVAEMARVCADAPGGRILLVQAAPGNQLVELYNAMNALAGLPRAHHGWLLAGAIDVLQMRGFSIGLNTVKSTVSWPENDAALTAELLVRLRFPGHPAQPAMIAEVARRVAESFARTPGELWNDAVLLVAKR